MAKPKKIYIVKKKKKTKQKGKIVQKGKVAQMVNVKVTGGGSSRPQFIPIGGSGGGAVYIPQPQQPVINYFGERPGDRNFFDNTPKAPPVNVGVQAPEGIPLGGAPHTFSETGFRAFGPSTVSGEYFTAPLATPVVSQPSQYFTAPLVSSPQFLPPPLESPQGLPPPPEALVSMPGTVATAQEELGTVAPAQEELGTVEPLGTATPAMGAGFPLYETTQAVETRAPAQPPEEWELVERDIRQAYASERQGGGPGPSQPTISQPEVGVPISAVGGGFPIYETSRSEPRSGFPQLIETGIPAGEKTPPRIPSLAEEGEDVPQIGRTISQDPGMQTIAPQPQEAALETIAPAQEAALQTIAPPAQQAAVGTISPEKRRRLKEKAAKLKRERELERQRELEEALPEWQRLRAAEEREPFERAFGLVSRRKPKK